MASDGILRACACEIVWRVGSTCAVCRLPVTLTDEQRAKRDRMLAERAAEQWEADAARHEADLAAGRGSAPWWTPQDVAFVRSVATRLRARLTEVV